MRLAEMDLVTGRKDNLAKAPASLLEFMQAENRTFTSFVDSFALSTLSSLS